MGVGVGLAMRVATGVAIGLATGVATGVAIGLGIWLPILAEEAGARYRYTTLYGRQMMRMAQWQDRTLHIM